MISYKIIISGKVQGVFFRYNTKQKAISLGLKGYVKNTENKVEVLLQGDKIKEMITWLKKGPKLSKVESVKIEKTRIEEYKDFKIIS